MFCARLVEIFIIIHLKCIVNILCIQRHWQKELDRRIEGHKPRVWMPFLKILYWRFLIVFVAAIMEVSVAFGL